MHIALEDNALRLCIHGIDHNGGQSSAAVTHPHVKVRDVSLNPAGARNQKRTLGTPLQKVAQWSGRDLSGRPAM